ncbi:MAG: hypothetical protein ACLTQG_30705 [Hungatella sp.]|uniref:hypothetical protein n=1 Tax=Hungatella sp. TaxID=2613924 RepID=UPI003991400E
MLRVLLVDDEPFIVQELTVLIDWEKARYEIAATDGKWAKGLNLLEKPELG